MNADETTTSGLTLRQVSWVAVICGQISLFLVYDIFLIASSVNGCFCGLVGYWIGIEFINRRSATGITKGDLLFARYAWIPLGLVPIVVLLYLGV
jgi:hypothetical protein